MKPTLESLENRDTPSAVVVVDTQTLLPHEQVRQAVDAVLYQIHHDLRRTCHTTRDTVRIVHTPQDILPGERRIYLEDGHADDLFLGQHLVARGPVRVDAGRAYDLTFGRNRKNPVAFVSVGGSLDQGGLASFTTTLSHEWLEMKVNPLLNRTAPLGTRALGVEIADPVNLLSYQRNGTALADFVLPAWFAPGKTGRMDFLGRVHRSLAVAPGGSRVL